MQRKPMIIVIATMVLCMVSSFLLVLLVGPRLRAAETVGELNLMGHFVVNERNQVIGLSNSGIEIAKNSTTLRVTLPEGVGTTYYEGTQSCFLGEYKTKVTEVILPSTMASIGPCGFMGCTNLTKIDFSRSKVATLAYRALYGCSSLTSIDLPETLTSIDSGGLSGTNIYGIKLPAGFKSMNVGAITDIVYVDLTQCPEVTFQSVFTYTNNKAKAVIVADADRYNAVYDTATGSDKAALTYPIDLLDINLTNENGVKSVQYEKILYNKNGWHYVDGKWQENNSYLPSLPALPDGYIWQETDGTVVDSARLLKLMQQAESSGNKITLDVIAVSEVNAPTASEQTFVYTGYPQIYYPEGYDAETMTIANNEQYNVGKYTVTVTLKNGFFADTKKQTATFDFVIEAAQITVPTVSSTTIYLGNIQWDNLTEIDIPFVSEFVEKIAVINPSYNTPVVTYKPKLYTISESHAGDSYAMDMPKITQDTTAGTYFIYYKVTASNHKDHEGMIMVTVKAGANPNIPGFSENETPTTPNQPDNGNGNNGTVKPQNNLGTIVTTIVIVAVGAAVVVAGAAVSVVMIRRRKK